MLPKAFGVKATSRNDLNWSILTGKEVVEEEHPSPIGSPRRDGRGDLEEKGEG